MPLPDDRNILKLGRPEHPGQVEITPAMVESVRERIKEAGGTLTVWAVLNEDVYETQFGDGFYLHVHGLALNSVDAHRLAALGGGDSELMKWHVRSYGLGLKGYVASPTWAYEIKGKWHRCPTMKVLPLSSPLDRFFRPSTRHFSEPGDSGSWVMHTKAPNEWLGMVVADSPLERTSYVTEAQFLLTVFEQKLAERLGPVSLAAYY